MAAAQTCDKQWVLVHVYICIKNISDVSLFKIITNFVRKPAIEKIFLKVIRTTLVISTQGMSFYTTLFLSTEKIKSTFNVHGELSTFYNVHFDKYTL